jgi:predicted Ser/Thr protein kinase
MIKKKVKAKKVSKRNPYLQFQAENILNELDPKNKIDFKFIGEGSYGEVYYFELKQNKIFQNVILKPGNYIIKVFKRFTSTEEIKYLEKLSKYGLIPKIFIINKKFSIMKYIESKTFLEFEENNRHNKNLMKKLFENVINMLQKWHELGYSHGDLDRRNILVSNNYKIYFIDPDFKNSEEEFESDNELIKGYLEDYHYYDSQL